MRNVVVQLTLYLKDALLMSIANTVTLRLLMGGARSEYPDRKSVYL